MSGLNAAQAGEPPGRWWGPGAQALGLTPGQIVQRKPYYTVYRQIDPRTRARLGRTRGRYPTFADHLARLTSAEPHATAERLIELEREAAQATRQPAVYTDVTVSFSKSISVLHASIRENERRARLAGNQQASAYWAGREGTFQQVPRRANRGRAGVHASLGRGYPHRLPRRTRGWPRTRAGVGAAASSS
ncbi:MAG: relaxase domain-containing protein [Streptosporangiaceae bacterium]